MIGAIAKVLKNGGNGTVLNYLWLKAPESIFTQK